MSSIDDAIMQLAENVRLFGNNATGDPERYNATRAMLNLAKSIKELQGAVSQLESDVRLIKSRQA